MNPLALTVASPQRSLALYARILTTQVLYITPLFWFMELLQNQLWRVVTGSFGWVYPDSPHGWFSFKSVVLWAGSVFLMWTLHYAWLYPRGVRPWLRVVIAGTVCWAGEWVGGFLAVPLTGSPLHVWPDTLLVYVSFPALFLWMGDVLVYYLLTRYVVDLTPGYAVPTDT